MGLVWAGSTCCRPQESHARGPQAHCNAGTLLVTPPHPTPPRRAHPSLVTSTLHLGTSRHSLSTPPTAGGKEAPTNNGGSSYAERLALLDQRLGHLMEVVRLGYLVEREGGWGAVQEWGEVLSLGEWVEWDGRLFGWGIWWSGRAGGAQCRSGARCCRPVSEKKGKALGGGWGVCAIGLGRGAVDR